MDWFPAYFFMVVAFFQVFEYSLLGTIVEIGNDNVYNGICNIQFYNLPDQEQMKIVLMILLGQNPNNLTIGGFQTLNVETFIVVSIPVEIRIIFSYLP
ncbi:putative odorant receptor 83c [Pseudolycoriella hygida]|uniref:Odorant receptor 83c n=1 Tax=Pseudolycoriella hygida TaxID=35572 RepID=A0A9Q0MI02_9DIPT|nr:putative odorant receptor 83c [Pseudolycoriella hygida]